jgi:DNA-binding CsgD family transcriptional regulator
VDSSAIGRPTRSLRLLERVEPLRALDDSLAAVMETRQGGLVLLRGEAGIGKTAVVRRFCEDQRPRRRILWGACEPMFTPRALGPFVDIAELARGAFQELVERGGRPHEVLNALGDEVRKSSPTILVLEDVHWADEATLDVLRLISRRIEGFRALVLVTYRDDELDSTPLLRIVLGELARTDGVKRLDITRLSEAAVAELAEPCEIDAEELYRKTGGNPFFVSEVLAAEAEEIPSTVRDAVLARAAGLSTKARMLLEAIAIAPPSAQLGVLEAIAGDAIRCLEECIALGMVSPAGPGVIFRHELARLVIEESVAPDRRAALHARALRALADSFDKARLAYHAEAAGDVDAVLRFAPEAASHAAALDAHRESAAQYARALRFAEKLSPDRRAELLECRSYECMVSDQTDAAIEALRDAIGLRRELGDVRAEGRALDQLANVLWCPGWVVEARDAALRAVSLLEQIASGRELAMAYSRLAQLSMDAEDLEGAVSWGQRAIDLAEVLGESDLAIHALNSVGTTRLLKGDIEGREQVERSLELAREAGLDDDVSRALTHLAWTAQRRRNYAVALNHLDSGLRQASERGNELRRGYQLAYRAQIELELGQWTDATDTAALVLREPRRSRVPRIVALCVTARVRVRRGDPEIWPLLDEASSLATRGEELQAEAPVALARAEAAWLRGDNGGVEKATTKALELARLRQADWLTSELLAWRRRSGIIDHISDTEVIGPYALELAADWSGAAARWRELGCPYEAALALEEADDQDAMRQALDELRAMGARSAEAIVARRLRERGGSVPRGPRANTRANPRGLTARELEVLALLADGLRNAEIAERLFLSAKTVDHHVSAILRKLGVRDRAGASVEAARLGLKVPVPPTTTVTD